MICEYTHNLHVIIIISLPHIDYVHHALVSAFINFQYYIDGIAWDWINEKLYWTDYSYHKIEVYRPSSNDRRVLFDSATVSSPRGIVVDPTTG